MNIYSNQRIHPDYLYCEHGPRFLQKHGNHLSCGHFTEWNVENTTAMYVLTAADV